MDNNKRRNSVGQSVCTGFNDKNPFNANYSFETFIVGKSNQYAYKLAKSIAEEPMGMNKRAYIYGGCGLGKTHLLHAIGNHILNKNENAKVRYTTAEQFTTDFIKALSQNWVRKFQEMYRSVDVLLVDDVQFLEGKAMLQEELFHTIEALEQEGKTIVFSGTVSPYNLCHINNEELHSRLKGCVTTQIDEPDYNCKVEILKRYIFEKGLVEFTYAEREAVVNFIASIVEGDIRELIGAWKRVSNFAEILGEPITLAYARKLLEDKTKSNEQLEPSTAFHIREPVINDYDEKYVCLICIKATFMRGNIAEYMRTNAAGDRIVGHFSIDETKIDEINFLDDLIASFDIGNIFRYLTNDTFFDLDNLMGYYYEDYECGNYFDKSKGWEELKEDTSLSNDVLMCCYEKYKRDCENKAIFLGELALYAEYSDIKSLTIEKTYLNASNQKFDEHYVKNFEIICSGESV